MAKIAFSVGELNRARAIAGPPGTFTLDMRLRNIERALIVAANAIPDYEMACDLWDCLRDATPIDSGGR